MSRSVTDVEARLGRFARRHDGDVVAVVDYVGRVGARIVVIAGSGEFGDALVDSVDDATAVCERLGVPVRPWDRELSARLAPSAADRIEMGRRAH